MSPDGSFESKPRPVYCVLREDFLLMDLSAAVEAFRMANELAGHPCFEIHYVAASASVVSSVGLSVGPVEALPDVMAPESLVVVVGTRSATLEAQAGRNRAMAAWLKATVRPEHLVMCVCSGAVLAGQAGLLDGKECTTHHDFCAQLAQETPSARVRENRIFVHDGNVFTSAGVTAGIDLALYVLGILQGEQLALEVARMMVVYLRRAGDDPQLSPLLLQRNHVHPCVHRVQDAVTQAPAKDWALSEMARLAQLSARQLTRVFVESTGTTPGAYVNLIRLTKAKELLDASPLPVERVAEDVGFGSARQFRRAFRERFGAAPSRWRRERHPKAVAVR